jgi:hypothetical protein
MSALVYNLFGSGRDLSNKNMENFQIYRQNLARELTSMSSEERRDSLTNKKRTSEYWEARARKLQKDQKGTEINRGKGILYRSITLYHGSGTQGIQTFREAEETTVGKGVYLTSSPRDCISYAHVRAGKDGTPVLYEALVKFVKFIDLRTSERVKNIMPGFKERLLKCKQKYISTGDDFFDETVIGLLDNSIHKIDQDEVTVANIRDVTKPFGEMFSRYLEDLGYDGLITYEGGEGRDFTNHDHDTFLVFNPDKVEITQEALVD